MNESTCSSVWPPRTGLCEQFETLCDSSQLWSQSLHCQDLADITEDRHSHLKSIWTVSQNHLSSTSLVNDEALEISRPLDNTPTHSACPYTANIVNSNDKWGNVKINQLTPWTIVEINDDEKHIQDPMVWRAKIDGTEVWEDYYLKQHGRRRPQSDGAIDGDNVWSLTTEMSQSSGSMWSPKMNDTGTPPGENFHPNIFNDISTRQNFNVPNGIRPSMTRNQAQKYLIDMGYSLSDAIGALVNNQMDLPKAINELQSKYRMSTNGHTIPNGMYNATLSFNNRSGENVNISRISAGTPLSNLCGQSHSTANPLMGPSFNNSFDLFHSTEPPDQIIDSQYIHLDNNVSMFGRIPDTKRQNSVPLNRDNIFRNNFPNNAMNAHSLSNNCGNYPDMNVLSQGVNRMNINFNQVQQNMVTGNNTFSQKWPINSNGFNGMHNTNNNNTNNMISSSGNNFDMRQNMVPGMSGAFGRSFSKPQQMYSGHPSWYSDTSSISSNGALNDVNQVRLAKNISYSGGQENSVGIIIKKVSLHHIELVKSICYESGSMVNFQLHPQIQAIVVHFNSGMDARRCISSIQSQINVRVDFLSDDYMPGVPCPP